MRPASIFEVGSIVDDAQEALADPFRLRTQSRCFGVSAVASSNSPRPITPRSSACGFVAHPGQKSLLARVAASASAPPGRSFHFDALGDFALELAVGAFEFRGRVRTRSSRWLRMRGFSMAMAIWDERISRTRTWAGEGANSRGGFPGKHARKFASVHQRQAEQGTGAVFDDGRIAAELSSPASGTTGPTQAGGESDDRAGNGQRAIGGVRVARAGR